MALGSAVAGVWRGPGRTPMTTAKRPVAEVLAQRTILVGEIARLNAVQLRNSQRAAGLEIETLTARRALADAEAQFALVRAALASDGARLDELDAQLAALDGELAAIKAG